MLRRLRNNNETKPKESELAKPKSKDAACSPIGPANQNQVGTISPCVGSKLPSPLVDNLNCVANTSNNQGGVAMSSNMATSPMQGMHEEAANCTGNSIK